MLPPGKDATPGVSEMKCVPPPMQICIPVMLLFKMAKTGAMCCRLLAMPMVFYLKEFEDLMRNGPRKPIRVSTVGDRVICDVFPRGCVCSLQNAQSGAR